MKNSIASIELKECRCTCRVVIGVSEVGYRGTDEGRARWRRLCLGWQIYFGWIRVMSVVSETCMTKHIAYLLKCENLPFLELISPKHRSAPFFTFRLFSIIF